MTFPLRRRINPANNVKIKAALKIITFKSCRGLFGIERGNMSEFGTYVFLFFSFTDFLAELQHQRRMWQYVWAHLVYHLVRLFPRTNRFKMYVFISRIYIYMLCTDFHGQFATRY